MLDSVVEETADTEETTDLLQVTDETCVTTVLKGLLEVNSS